MQNHLSFAICPLDSTCDYVSHLKCLSANFLSDTSHVLPHQGSCPGCGGSMEWGQVIRACYARIEGIQREEEEALKTTKKAKRRGRRQKEDDTSNTEDEHSSMTPEIRSMTLETPPKRSLDRSASDTLNDETVTRAKRQPRTRTTEVDDSDGGMEWERFEKEMRAIR
ncbi:hypothetical protein I302_106108 [Kwoniella bestiolae CBS 10118]|uniref:Structure-specific endonuclease subunit SLX1 C-terminal domain-containing protein n=1 Tax=Kwoniella bestiolae CBS 10118 TaxID=1296100 RepID=A0AAJ8KAC4_9TREE